MSDLYSVNLVPPGRGDGLGSFCVETVITREDVSNKITAPNDVGLINVEGEFYTEIEEDAFYDLTNLRGVSIIDTLITEIPENLFKFNTRIKRIVIRENNKLTFLPQGLFEGKRKMSEIDISYNPITSIPLSIAELPELYKLDLTGTDVSKSNFLEMEYDWGLITGLRNLLQHPWDQYKFKTRPMNIFVFASTYAQDIFHVQSILDGLNEFFYIGKIYHWDEFFGLGSEPPPGKKKWIRDYEECEFLLSDICIIFHSHMFGKIDYDEPHLDYAHEAFSDRMNNLHKHKISVSMNDQHVPLDFSWDNIVYVEDMNVEEITEVIAVAILEYFDENIESLNLMS